MNTTLRLILVLACALTCASLSADDPDFGREVRPILAKHCFTCHGPDPDAREAELRLDTQEGSRTDLGGYSAIVQGKPDESELMARVAHVDPDLRMPPSDKHPPLSKLEIDTLQRWIASGGQYKTHWAFTKPTKVFAPRDASDEWSRGPIDRFIIEQMKQKGLQPTEPAANESWIRRVYLDLAGITPTPAEVEQFLADESPMARRRVVDRLLASPDYAERFARPWLDLARYSDTNGYEKDRPRTIWPYRDWVIKALAADMPFDQFTIEQMAGDMLPNATLDQRVATGFHRNTMMNEEGGIDPLEYRFYAMVDRVATTGTVWMGLTVGCAQCHTHKYDPITHTDYYSLMALMNSADEPEVELVDKVYKAKQSELQKEISAEIDRLVKQHLPATIATKSADAIHQAFAKWTDEKAKQARDWQSLKPVAMESTMPILTVQDDNSVLASGDVTKRDVYKLTFELADTEFSSPAISVEETIKKIKNELRAESSQNFDDAKAKFRRELQSIAGPSLGPATALKLEVLPHDSLPAGGPGMAFYEGRRGDFFLSEVNVTFNGKPVELKDASHSYGKISVGSGKPHAANVMDGDGSTGWSTSGAEGKANRLVVNFSEPLKGPGKLEVELLFERHFAAALGHFRISLTDGTPALAGQKTTVAMSLPQELDASINNAMVVHLGQVSPASLEGLKRHFVRTAPEMKPHRKKLEQLEKQIQPAVRTLGMRERLAGQERQTHRHHRGEYLQPKEQVTPAVPELFESIEGTADRLALARWLVSEKNPLVGRVTVNRAWREFFGTGIVRTAGDFGTQSEPPSHPQLLDWLDGRFRDGGFSMKRLHREIVLSATYRQSVSAPPASDPTNRLLSCFPHRRFDAERIRDAMLSASGLMTRQIGGPSVYPPQPASVTQIAYGNSAWKASSGADRYRRSLYTFSKRTAPFAAFTTFDGPSGELCIARRDRSTTPLQALTLMNDAMYLEIARGLAETSLRELEESADAEAIATRIFQRLLTRTPTREELAAIIDFYKSQSPHSEPWTLVARALINTDEAITTP